MKANISTILVIYLPHSEHVDGSAQKSSRSRKSDKSTDALGKPGN